MRNIDQTKVQVTITAGVDQQVCEELVNTLRQILPVGDIGVYERKSAGELPQYIQLIGSLADWAILKIPAVAYLSAYASRRAILLANDHHARPNEPIEVFAEALTDAAKRLPPKVGFQIGIDLPDERWGTVLHLTTREPKEAARQLAVFFARLPDIHALVANACENDTGPAAQGTIVVLSDDSIELRWQALDGFDFRDVTFSLPSLSKKAA
jgi:hypothetical protein